MFNRPTNDFARIEQMLQALQFEIDLLRETAVRTETRLCKLAIHLGGEHIVKEVRQPKHEAHHI